jgi:hypothetical protein
MSRSRTGAEETVVNVGSEGMICDVGPGWYLVESQNGPALGLAEEVRIGTTGDDVCPPICAFCICVVIFLTLARGVEVREGILNPCSGVGVVERSMSDSRVRAILAPFSRMNPFFGASSVVDCTA